MRRLAVPVCLFAGLILMLSACEPTRAAARVACVRDSQCPADGRHFCNLSVGECQTCDGTCSVAATSDTVAETSAAETAAGDAANDVASDAAADVTPSTDAFNDASCQGRCDKFLSSAPCQCDALCAANKDCCSDYAALCAKPDAGGIDSGADVSGADSTPLPVDTSASGAAD